MWGICFWAGEMCRQQCYVAAPQSCHVLSGAVCVEVGAKGESDVKAVSRLLSAIRVWLFPDSRPAAANPTSGFIRSAVAINLKGKSHPKPRRVSGKQTG